jgi:hypothetical protein
VIVGWYKFGAKYAGPKQREPVTIFPKLQYWSDIAFLSWKARAIKRNNDGKLMRFIFSASVGNDVSLQLMYRILNLQGGDGEFSAEEHCKNIPWGKRLQFTMTSDEGKVLLASPNGYGAAMLLIQHKSTFGPRTTISGVTVYCHIPEDEDKEGSLHFMFHVVQAQPN